MQIQWIVWRILWWKCKSKYESFEASTNHEDTLEDPLHPLLWWLCRLYCVCLVDICKIIVVGVKSSSKVEKELKKCIWIKVRKVDINHDFHKYLNYFYKLFWKRWKVVCAHQSYPCARLIFVHTCTCIIIPCVMRLFLYAYARTCKYK